jgi:hypothetical protein
MRRLRRWFCDGRFRSDRGALAAYALDRKRDLRPLTRMPVTTEIAVVFALRCSCTTFRLGIGTIGP